MARKRHAGRNRSIDGAAVLVRQLHALEPEGVSCGEHLFGAPEPGRALANNRNVSVPSGTASIIGMRLQGEGQPSSPPSAAVTPYP